MNGPVGLHLVIGHEPGFHILNKVTAGHKPSVQDSRKIPKVFRKLL